MSGAIVAGFYNTLYPSLVGANFFFQPNVSCTSNSCETLCSSCEDKEDRYAHLISKPCMIYGNFKTNINFIISSSSEPAQWSSSNNAKVGLRSCANGSNVSRYSDHATSVCVSDRQCFLYWHWWVFLGGWQDRWHHQKTSFFGACFPREYLFITFPCFIFFSPGLLWEDNDLNWCDTFP